MAATASSVEAMRATGFCILGAPVWAVAAGYWIRLLRFRFGSLLDHQVNQLDREPAIFDVKALAVYVAEVFRRRAG